LCAEVSDSITWRRFCRIPLDGRVPHPTTLMTAPPGIFGRIGVIALGVVGLGTFLDGCFRVHCQSIDAGCNATNLSWQDIAHGIETQITMLGLVVAVFALALAFKSHRAGTVSGLSLSPRASQQSSPFCSGPASVSWATGSGCWWR